MARLPRFPGAGFAHHVVQRGHNGQRLALDDEDRRAWRALLVEALATRRVALHAWVLLPEQFHLVVTPPTDADVASVMQAFGRRYAAAFNRRHGRRGTLWEGRYGASLLEPGQEVLRSLLFVDGHLHRNGAQAEGAPGGSSLAHHLGQDRDPLLVDPPEFWALGNTPFERQAAYAALLEGGLSQAQVERIASAVRRGWPLGSAGFVAGLEASAGRLASPRPRGRPPRRAV